MDKNADTAEFKQNTRADKLHLLFKLSFPAVFISTLNASLLMIALWPGVSHTKLAIWYLAIVIVSVIRTVLFLNYRFRTPFGDAVLSWEMTYFVTLIASALVWGMGGLWLVDSASAADQLIIFFFLVGMAGGALSVYSAIHYIVLSTVASVLLPVTVWFLVFGDGAPRIAAVGSVLFLISSLRSSRVLSTALHQSFLLGHQLRHAKEQSERMARTDYLTGLNNRGALYELAASLVAHCRRHRYPLSLIVLDLDDFKGINDSYGHATGDAALRQTAQLIRTNIRTSDVSGRIGGEEFVILLPDTDLEQAEIVAEKIRNAMERCEIATDDLPVRVTASFGVATGSYDVDELLALADRALYRAKAAGKNRIHLARYDLTDIHK